MKIKLADLNYCVNLLNNSLQTHGMEKSKLSFLVFGQSTDTIIVKPISKL